MYPCPGRRLLPLVMHGHFGARRVSSQRCHELGLKADTTFKDLNESVWQKYSSIQVSMLAGEIISALKEGLPPSVAGLTVFARGPAIDDLDVSLRTGNALRRARILDSGRLREMTVGAVWNINHFGAISLLDLLTALEALEAQAPLDHQLVERHAPLSLFDDFMESKPVDALPASAGESVSLSREVRSAAATLSRTSWAGQVTAEDPRLGTYLVALSPSSRNAKEAALSLAAAFYARDDAEQTAAAILGLVDRAELLRSVTIEVELEQIIDAHTDRATAKAAILARTGFSGAEPMTLESAGQLVGVTRERVRQIEKRFKESVRGCGTIWTPVLDRCLQVVGSLVPASPSALQQALIEAGLASGPFSIAALLSAAEMFGKGAPFQSIDDSFAPPGDWAELPVIQARARRLVEHWGATTVADLEIRLRDDGFDVDHRLLVATLRDVAGFRSLDEERGWFWIRGTRNRLLNQVRKIMSVAGTIELADLRAGVGRHHRMQGFRPPREVLARLCVDSGDYIREGDRICGGPNLPDWRVELGQNERLLVETLFDYGPVMRRDDLERIVVAERGMNRASFYVYLTYSPILERYAPGVFGLRGAPVSATQVDALIPARERHQVLQDHGWTPGGQLWAGFRISPSAESTGILGTPAAIGSVAKGSYGLFAEDQRPVGTLVVAQSMWGLSPFFRSWGVEAGDFVVIVLDLKLRTATIAAGNEELLLRYQAGD